MCLCPIGFVGDLCEIRMDLQVKAEEFFLIIDLCTHELFKSNNSCLFFSSNKTTVGFFLGSFF